MKKLMGDEGWGGGALFFSTDPKCLCFKHVYVQATCQRDPEVYATCHYPKIYPHIPTSNYIQI